MIVALADKKPFAQGGNRLCFVHPDDPNKCIKVRRPDFTLEQLRRKKGFPKCLKPLSFFDDNLEEFKVMQQLDKHYGDALYRHVSRCYGFEESDLGRGITSDLIRNQNGDIAFSLKQFIWENGKTSSLKQAIDDFVDFWSSRLIPSRELLLHNIVAQCDQEGQVIRLVIIDGLGSPGIIPDYYLPKSLRISKTQRKIARFYARLQKFTTEIQAGKTPSHVGRLLHSGNDADNILHTNKSD